MKRFILGIIVGGIVFGTIGGVVAYNYSAKDVEYTPSDNTWNVSSVNDALVSLYTKSKNYKCISGSGIITSDFKTSTGGLLFDFVPSEFYIYFSTGHSEFYINGLYESKVWALSPNQNNWVDVTGLFTIKNNKYYGINWANVGSTFNYVVCK